MFRLLPVSKVAADGEDVHVDAAAALAVLDRRPGVAVRLEPGPGRPLELVEHGFDLRMPVGRSSGAQAITPEVYLCSKLERVGDGGHLVGIAAADLDAVAHASRPRPARRAGSRCRRPGRAGPAGDEFNVHRQPLRRRGRARPASARCRPGWR